MKYSFANTYRQDADTYYEDRGYLHKVSKGDPNFDVVDAYFRKTVGLDIGQSALHDGDDGWEIVDGFAAKEAYDAVMAKRIRAERDAKLAKTDYLMMPDYPLDLERKTKVEEYRKALRDISKQEGWPNEVVWPKLELSD